MLTIGDILNKCHRKLDFLDIELLVADTIKKTREFVLAYPGYRLNSLKIENLKLKIARRMKGEPLASILGRREFFGLDFKVNKHVLVPRPETELLVEQALKEVQAIRGKQKAISIIDIGTGSGNIIISIAKVWTRSVQNKSKRHFVSFYGTDISPKALAVARRNAKIHKMDKKIKFLRGSLLEPILKAAGEKLKSKNYVIIANLPYLDPGWKNLLKSSDAKGLRYEPRVALYAGKDGLDAYRKLAEQIKLLAASYKLPIAVICEIGHLQKREIKKMFSFARKKEFKKDLAGRWRVFQAKI